MQHWDCFWFSGGSRDTSGVLWLIHMWQVGSPCWFATRVTVKVPRISCQVPPKAYLFSWTCILNLALPIVLLTHTLEKSPLCSKSLDKVFSQRGIIGHFQAVSKPLCWLLGRILSFLIHPAFLPAKAYFPKTNFSLLELTSLVSQSCDTNRLSFTGCVWIWSNTCLIQPQRVLPWLSSELLKDQHTNLTSE